MEIQDNKKKSRITFHQGIESKQNKNKNNNFVGGTKRERDLFVTLRFRFWLKQKLETN